MERKARLGRGLDALLGTTEEQGTASANAQAQVTIDTIDQNPFQPRKTFDQDEIKSLSETIRAHGILQPLVVRQVGERCHRSFVTVVRNHCFGHIDQPLAGVGYFQGSKLRTSLLQIAIVLETIAVVLDRGGLWYGGLLIGAAGTLALSNGFIGFF